MTGKRELLSKSVRRFMAPELLQRLAGPPRLVVLTYHRVIDVDASTYPLDPATFDATPEQFDRQMSFISRHCTALTASELAPMLRGEALWPKHPVLITFDDGYKDNLHVACPILERHGLRATAFIATDYIENRRLFWWDFVAYAMAHCRKEQASLDYPLGCAGSLRTAEERERFRRTVLFHAKRIPGIDLDHLKESLCRGLDVEVPERDLAEEHICTWDEVRELKACGMEIASHTHTHRMLSQLPPEEAQAELTLSRRLLRERVGIETTTLSYPAGFIARWLDGYIRASGYDMGFSYALPAERIDRLDPLHLPRLALNRADSQDLFQGRVLLPGIFQ